MKSYYKKLGQFIVNVNKRNTGLKVTNLKGLSMTKEFRESTSNIVGTDMSKYKIVEQWQFACDFMSIIRVHAFPVVLNTNVDPVLVSPAYPVFEIKNKNLLDPEYLMMWLKRKEFDRFADFKCDSAIRGGFGWQEMCDIELPVPPIGKQREIVREYNVVNDRIKMNEKINQKLEETAQAIYKQWFVDFEFPITKEYAESIGNPELEGKPYKSSSGKMVYCDELDNDIPVGWDITSLNKISSIGSSKRVFQREYVANGIPFYRGKEIILKKNGDLVLYPLYITNKKYYMLKNRFGKPEVNDILLTAVGTLGVSYLVRKEDFYFKDGNILWIKNYKNNLFSYYIYDFMQTTVFFDFIKNITIGSTQNAITIESLGQCKITLPTNNVLKKYFLISDALKKMQSFQTEQKKLCFKLTQILLQQLSKV